MNSYIIIQNVSKVLTKMLLLKMDFYLPHNANELTKESQKAILKKAKLVSYLQKRYHKLISALKEYKQLAK